MKFDPDLRALRSEAVYLYSEQQRRISQATYLIIMETTMELQGLRDSIRAQHMVIEMATA